MLKKTPNKNLNDSKKEHKAKKKSTEDFDEDLNIKDDHQIEEMLEEEMLGDLDEEDDEEFIHQVEEFKKEHAKVKMKSIYAKIGKPKFKELKKLDPKSVKNELKKLILVLDKHNIIVHFHNDYPEREKYRFITEEIFKEVAEDDKKHHHITFVYEDYHPEMGDEDEDEESLSQDF